MSDKPNVVVTGGAGYVGSHTSKALSESGFQPIVIDDLTNGHEWAVQWGPLVKGDVRDTRLVTEVIRSCRAAAVLHFAASIEVGESVKNPLIFYQNNVGGTLSLLAAMEQTDLKTLIFSSTAAIYGMPEGALLPENSPQDPINPYGHTKLTVERMLADLAAHGKLRYAALRYFNASGADPLSRIGEDHDPETHLIPLAIRASMQATKGGAPLKIFGTDFPTADGTAVRDYIHVEDLASAHVAGLQYLLGGGKTDAFNVGTGIGHSVLQVIEGLEALGLHVPTERTARRPGDPPCLVANPAKANRVLGWHAAMSDLPTILSTAVAWHEKRAQPSLSKGSIA